MLLNILQCTGEAPQQRLILPQMSAVPRLRSPDPNILKHGGPFKFPEHISIQEKNKGNLGQFAGTLDGQWVQNTVIRAAGRQHKDTTEFLR